MAGIVGAVSATVMLVLWLGYRNLCRDTKLSKVTAALLSLLLSAMWILLGATLGKLAVWAFS